MFIPAKVGLDSWIGFLKAYEVFIKAAPAAELDITARGDREILLGTIRSQLLTLGTIRPWEKNPDLYSSTAANAAFTLMERRFAPPDDRLGSLIARESKMPALFAEARVNLKNPPRIFTEIAIEQLPDIVSFFEHDVPLAFADAKDPALKAEFKQTNAAVIAALKSYLAWGIVSLLCVFFASR